MKLGDKVKLIDGKKEKTGVVHAIKKADLGEGEVVVGYLVTVGKDETQIEVSPEDIRKAE